MTPQEKNVLLGDLCSVTDCEHKTAPNQEDGIPLIRTPNIGKGRLILDGVRRVSETTYRLWTRRDRPQTGDLIMAREAPVGNVALIGPGQQVCLGQRTVLIRKKSDRVDPVFLSYLMNSPAVNAYVNMLSVGATVGHLNVSDIRKLALPGLPHPTTQRKIAAVLAAYDDLIEANQRRIALLEKMAEEIYREWFVRLRFLGHATTKISKGVPAGWDVARLGSVLELRYGKAMKEENRIPGPYLVYGSSGVVGSHNEAHVQGPGIIVGRKGNVGSVFLADSGFFVIDTAFYVVSALPRSFLYFLLRSMNFINNDSAVPGLNRNQAYANQLFLPPERLIAEFAKIVDPKFEATRILRVTNENLTRTRDLLLPRLISGKLSVESLDIAFPPSMAER